MLLSKRILRANTYPIRKQHKCGGTSVAVSRDLICFKYWAPEMIDNIIQSAINLKKLAEKRPISDKIQLLRGTRVTLLQEQHESLLKLVVYDAAALLGASFVKVTDHVVYRQAFLGSVFSQLTDVILASSSTHGCMEKFKEDASVPVVNIRSRVHQPLQALAGAMTVMEEYGSLCGQKFCYIGPPAGILNSYLLLCPMVGACIKFLCCCQETTFSPLLFQMSKDFCAKAGTSAEQAMDKCTALRDATVIISGPSKNRVKPPNKDTFNLDVEDIQRSTKSWIYFHTLPKGLEVTDRLYCHKNARTLKYVNNLRYIAAALMANSVKQHLF